MRRCSGLNEGVAEAPKSLVISVASECSHSLDGLGTPSASTSAPLAGLRGLFYGGVAAAR